MNFLTTPAPMNEIDAALNQLFDEIKRGVLLQAKQAASRSTSRQTFRDNMRPIFRTLSHHGATYTGALRQALAVYFFPVLSEETGRTPEEQAERLAVLEDARGGAESHSDRGQRRRVEDERGIDVDAEDVELAA
jgi:hypothetical protein